MNIVLKMTAYNIGYVNCIGDKSVDINDSFFFQYVTDIQFLYIVVISTFVSRTHCFNHLN
ncbi:hypothetical protein [Bacillus thuringiensis]|uniref:hypothetical protein n=1 Tax=Bacillus thuringiensis TaxID=1428 RepID=UPI0021D6755F|nr:hypothetical protein [Bacillus thuringiensis]MCU7663745.1 hypothetical protein [Bacillus thuringiensis]